MGRIVITGANSGIGLELARQYAGRGEQVVAVCRRASPELSDLGPEAVIEGIDVTDDDAVDRMVREIGDRPIDVLINNAGILSQENLDDLDYDSIRRQFEINSLGPIRVSLALAPLMASGSRLAIVSSWLGSIAENRSGGNLGYRMSKAAVNMAGVTLAHELRSKGIAVVLLHPGYVRTKLTSGGGTIDPDESARGLIARIDALSLDTTGSFWHADGHELPW